MGFHGELVQRGKQAPRCLRTSVSGFVGAGEVPQAVQDLSMFSRPDYIDCFVLAAPDATASSPEAWARATLERAELSRRSARRAWTLMGMRLGPPHSQDHVQGWRIGHRADKWLRLQTSSWYLDASAVFLVEEGRVSLSLSLRYTSPAARFAWALISGHHQRAVPVMLRQAAGMTHSPMG